jgi:hypothetical protein
MTKKANTQQRRQEDLPELLKSLKDPDLEMIESFESIIKLEESKLDDLTELLKSLKDPDLEMIESFESIVELEESKLEGLLKKLQFPDVDPAHPENLPELMKE